MAIKTPEELGLIQLLSLTLSILIIVGLAIEFFFPLSPPATDLLDQLDFVICLFFMCDFFHRFFLAHSKLSFLKWGWIDFISSIPVTGFFQLGRLARILRILRVLRLFRSTHTVWSYVANNRPKATLKGAVLLAVLTYILSSIAILEFETARNSNILTPNDALWWSFTTMITVGCEKYPVTEAGRLIGALLSVVGVGLTGVYTAYIASFFIGSAKHPVANEEILKEIKALRIQLKLKETR